MTPPGYIADAASCILQTEKVLLQQSFSTCLFCKSCFLCTLLQSKKSATTSLKASHLFSSTLYLSKSSIHPAMFFQRRNGLKPVHFLISPVSSTTAKFGSCSSCTTSSGTFLHELHLQKELPSILPRYTISSSFCTSSHCAAIWSPSRQVSSSSPFSIREQSQLRMKLCSTGLCTLCFSPSCTPSFSSLLTPGTTS